MIEFDDKPIGGHSKGINFADEYPPGYDPNQKPKEEEQVKMPLTLRIKSTVFKTRKEALEELIELYKNTENINDGIFSEYVSLFVKFVSDSNPACLEKGFAAIQAWCEKQDSLSAIPEPTEFLKIIIEKALSTGRQVIVDASYEIFSLFIEKELKDEVLNALKMCFSHKNQKVQCCSIEAVLELLKRFGIRKLDYMKQFLPEIQKLCESTISSVKALIMTFFKETYKWMGDAVKSYTDKMKKQQLDELEKFYNEYKEGEELKPTRQSAILEEEQLNKGGKGKIKTKIDNYELAVAQDVFNKFNENWTDTVLSTAKWSDKKELLDELIKAASVTKIVPNNFSPVVQMCKKLLNDSNVQIQLCAIKIVGLMALGLRKAFSQSAKLLSTLLVDKFKDKKQPIVDEALKTLKNYFYCISLDELFEDLKDALNDKNAGSKMNAMNLLLLCIEEEKYKNTYKQLFPQFKKLIDDSSEEVRNKTIQLVGKLKGYYTDSFTQPITLNINQQKMAKIDQYASQVQPFAQSDPSSYNFNLDKQQFGVGNANNKSDNGIQLKKNQSQNQLNGQKSQKNNNLQSQQSNQISKDIKGNNNQMEIESNLPNLNNNGNQRMDISKELDKPLRKIQEQKQQSKKEGLDILEVLLQQANYKISSNGISELVIALKKCLSESNKSLARQFIQFVAKFGEALVKDAKFYSKTLVPGIMQNLSDKQALVRTEAQNALEKWAELIGIEQIINFIPPFLGYESLEIRIDGYLKSDLKIFVIPILQCLTDKNKEIRTLGEQILEITLQVYPISHFYDSVKDFKPAVVQQLRLIFEKYSDVKQQDPSKFQNNNNDNGYGQQQMQSNHGNQYQQINNISAAQNNPYTKINQPVKPVPSNHSFQFNAFLSFQQCIAFILTMDSILLHKCNLIQPNIKQNKKKVESTQTLKERRMDKEEEKPWPLDKIDDILVEELIEHFRHVGIPNDLRLQMFSYNSATVILAAKYIKEKISVASQISDLLIKWSFLRFWEQYNINACIALLDMLKEIFNCLKSEQYYLQDYELNIILGGMYLAMQQHKSTELVTLVNLAHERLRLICSTSKIMKFWIARLQLNGSMSEQIMLVLNSGLFTSELSNELGTLAKIPQVATNKIILDVLIKTYGEHVMKAYGFDISSTFIEEAAGDNKVTDEQGILEIKQNLYKLGNKDINMKLYTVHFLNEAFQNPEQIQIMIKHSDMIIIEITKYLSACMIELKQKEIQFEFFNSFLNLFIKITNTKQFFSSISLTSANNVTETILTELIQADENKDDKNSLAAVKQLNTLMLRVLENTHIHNMFCILFDLLIIYRRKNEYSKVIAIIIKCILKLTKVLRDDWKEIQLDKLFVKFHEYITENNNENQKSDDIGIKAIKTVLSELFKFMEKPILMQNYQILENHPVKDTQIIKMIENITSTKTIHHSPLIKSTPFIKATPNSNHHSNSNLNSNINNNINVNTNSLINANLNAITNNSNAVIANNNNGNASIANNTINNNNNINNQALDKVSQLKLRYQQIITNRSPSSQLDDDNSFQKSIQKLNTSLSSINPNNNNHMSNIHHTEYPSSNNIAISQQQQQQFQSLQQQQQFIQQQQQQFNNNEQQQMIDENQVQHQGIYQQQQQQQQLQQQQENNINISNNQQSNLF